MKSPFATALAVARRELDVVRVEIGEQTDRQSCIEAIISDLDARMASERRAAATATDLPATNYFDCAAAERHALTRDSSVVEQLLEQLRTEAAERFAAVKALELADERWVAERRRQLELREQAAADDRASFSFASRQRGQSC